MELNWKKIGYLSEVEKFPQGTGVYLFEYGGKIIYVGSAASSFRRRLTIHHNLFLCGGRTFRIPHSNLNIYDLFKIEDDEQERKLHDDRKLWIPSNISEKGYYQSKYRNLFDEEWRSLARLYISNINVYISEISLLFNLKLIESKIQDEITNAFNLGEYTTTSGTKSGKLGKQEYKGEILKEVCLKFKGDIKVDKDTIEVLKQKFGLIEDICND